MHADFVEWDDPHNVSANPALNPPNLGHLLRYWRAPVEGLYIPITNTAWTGLAQISQLIHGSGVGLDARVFHAGNLLAHALSALLVYSILKELFGDPVPSALGAAVFAVHPMQVEAVAWISGLKDVLAGTFGLLAIRLHVTAGASRRSYVGATGALFAALLCKPSAVAIPLIAAVIDVLIRRRPLRATLRDLLPWVILSIPFVILTRAAQPARDASLLFGWWQRPLVAADALAFYLWKLVWPAKLALDYGRRPVALAWIVPVILGIALVLAGRRWPVLLAGAAVFVLALLPVLGLVPFDFQIYSTVADHYAYVAMLGPAIAIAWLPMRWRVVKVAVALGIPVLAGLTFVQAARWRNTRVILGHTLDVNPHSWVSHINLSADALLRNDTAAAIEHAHAARAMRPNDTGIYLNLGQALGMTGDFTGAEAAFRHALSLGPPSAAVHANLGLALAAQGRDSDAAAEFRLALQLDPANELARRGLAAQPPTSAPSR